MAADSGEGATAFAYQILPENRERSSWSRRSAQIDSASGEIPDGRTIGFTDRNGDKMLLKTFNQNNGSCHSTTVSARKKPACIGCCEGASVESLFDSRDRGEPLILRLTSAAR